MSSHARAETDKIPAMNSKLLLIALLAIVGLQCVNGGSPLGWGFKQQISPPERQIATQYVARPDGSGEVLYVAHSPETGSDSVHVQTVDISGVPVGQARVITSAGVEVDDVAVHSSVDDDGSYPVVYQVGCQLFLTMLNASNEVTLDSQLIVNEGCAGGPEVAAANDGFFMVIWLDTTGLDGSDHGIFGKYFLPDGNEIIGRFQVNTYSFFRQDKPNIAVSNNGTYLATWASFHGGTQFNVFAQEYDELGLPIGSERQLNSVTTSSEEDPQPAFFPDGGQIVSWSTLWIGPSRTWARIFDADGSPATSDTIVSAYDATSSLGSANNVVALDNNIAFVVYTTDGFEGGVISTLGQFIGRNGTLLDAPIEIGSTFGSNADQQIALQAITNCAVVPMQNVDIEGDTYIELRRVCE